MKRYPLEISEAYTTALSNFLNVDLSAEALSTRSGKAYIAEKAEIVSRLSIGLTTRRDEFLSGSYLSDAKVRQAYALYYMTTNTLKVIAPLRELSVAGFFSERQTLRVLDLGTGTGAAAWGIQSYLSSIGFNSPMEIMLTDRYAENLMAAESFSKHFLNEFTDQRPKLSFEKFDLRKHHLVPDSVQRATPYDLVTAMNVLNELDENNDTELLHSLTKLISDDGAILLIEPATRDLSRRLGRFRDLAAKHGVTVFSPCIKQAQCPALLNEDDWCHSETPWVRPAFIKAIDEIAGTLRLSLKYSYVILRKDPVVLADLMGEDPCYRVVSERFNEKGRVRAILCGESGRSEHVINKRDVSQSNSDFTNIERYDVISIAGGEVREHDVRLPGGSSVKIVLPKLGAR